MHNQKRADDLFAAALELEPDQRSEFLAVECGHDALLIAEVSSLLTFAEQVDALEFMKNPALDVSAQQVAEEEADQRDRVGQLFGRYKIVSLIGEGGMGKVYLAQDTELSRQVALKLISGNLTTKDILRRFQNERQILANLQHPNIAQLLDGGSTAEGLPFFVMEYVEGQPLNDYAAARELSTADRLKLFRTICSALSYAHQNLVIHRDIKPSNILVTADGTPKLLDFGIAKLLHAVDAGDAAEATATVMQVMTPEYASPEQVKGENMTTASDVYSLGVVLYELLTGLRPYRFKSRKPEDLRSAICDQEPVRPSTAVSSQSSVVSRRRNDNGQLATDNEQEPIQSAIVNPKLLRGDLDNIVLMALRKEPTRRYGSVAEFSEDIRRHLAGLPVIARKTTFSYRTSKFITRNKLGVAAAAVVFVTLVAGIAATSWEARRANRRFNDVRKLAHSVLFDYHDAIAALPGSTHVREQLVKDSLEYLDSLAMEAGNDVSLQRELANAYAKVGDVQGGASTPVGGLTISAANLGDTAGALASHRKALAIRDRLAANDPTNKDLRRELLYSYTRLGDLFITLGQPETAVEFFRKATTISEALSVADPTNEILSLELDQVYYATGKALGGPSTANIGDTKGGSEYLRKALAIDEALAALHPAEVKYRQSLAASYNALGLMLSTSGQWSEEQENYRKALAIDQALVKGDGNNAFYRRELAVQYGNLGSCLVKAGDKVGALEQFRQAQSLYDALVIADPGDVNIRRNSAVGYRNIGVALGGTGDRVGALESFRIALQLFAQLVAKDQNNADFRRQEGLTYLRSSTFMSDTGDLQGALAGAEQARALDEALVAAAPKNTVARSNLALIYSQLGKVHFLSAGKAGMSSDQQAVHWRAARDWYQKGLGIWQEMKSNTTLTGADASKPEEVAKDIARCDAALAR
jgi:serine/threonine protein kinase/tetratricopeptide (TPR) repeat protein